MTRVGAYWLMRGVGLTLVFLIFTLLGAGCRRPSTVVGFGDLSSDFVTATTAFVSAVPTNRVALARSLCAKINFEQEALRKENKWISVMTLISLCGPPDGVQDLGSGQGYVLYALSTNRPMNWVLSVHYGDHKIVHSSVGGITY